MASNARKSINVALKELLSSGFAGTQDDISIALGEMGIEVNQSTVSRALKKLGAVKSSNGETTVYQLPRDVTRAHYAGSVSDLVLSIEHNESMIIIKTVTGSASFVGEYLDHAELKCMLGIIAGDDTLFVAPRSTADMDSSMDEIEEAIRG